MQPMCYLQNISTSSTHRNIYLRKAQVHPDHSHFLVSFVLAVQALDRSKPQSQVNFIRQLILQMNNFENKMFTKTIKNILQFRFIHIIVFWK